MIRASCSKYEKYGPSGCSKTLELTKTCLKFNFTPNKKQNLKIHTLNSLKKKISFKNIEIWYEKKSFENLKIDNFQKFIPNEIRYIQP